MRQRSRCTKRLGCGVSSNTGASSSEQAASAVALARGDRVGRTLGRARGRVGLGSPTSGTLRCNTVRLELLQRIEAHVRRHELVAPGGEVLCLVSGGADSTCLFHALRELGYRVSALHVDHGLRGEESDADAAWCEEVFGAEVVQGGARCSREAGLRDIRYSFRHDRLRATGHTLSDQVETILYRLAARGTTKGIEV